MDSKTLFMLEWEKDLGQTWSLANWHMALYSAFKEILKVLMRWYLVPLKLSKMYPTSSSLCFWNCGHVGSMKSLLDYGPGKDGKHTTRYYEEI